MGKKKNNNKTREEKGKIKSNKHFKYIMMLSDSLPFFLFSFLFFACVFAVQLIRSSGSIYFKANSSCIY